MKVLAINGSSRKNGNTAIALNTIMEELEKQGIETEMIQLAGTTINPCKACFTCGGKNNYSFNNDMFAEIFEKMVNSDGIILGSPVYSADVSSNMKALIDRGAVVADMYIPKDVEGRLPAIAVCGPLKTYWYPEYVEKITNKLEEFYAKNS